MTDTGHIVVLGNSRSVHIQRWVKGISERGFKVSLFSTGQVTLKDEVASGASPGKHRRFDYIKDCPKVRRQIKALHPDLVHSHYATGYGLWGMYSGFHPFVLSVWGSDIAEFPRNRVRRIFLRKILRSADAVTAPSAYLRNEAVELETSLAERIGVIPFGVEIPAMIPKRQADNKVRLLFLKALQKKYGPDILLKAVRLAAEKNDKIFLTMAGEGYMAEELQEMSREAGLAERVSFVGQIPHSGVPALLAEHDILVMPSLLESFGVAAAEASAFGLPVIASRVGGIPEVVIEGKTGILTEPNNPEDLSRAIVQLAADPELRRRLGAAGRRHIEENFSWRQSVDMMVELYVRLIKERGRR